MDFLAETAIFLAAAVLVVPLSRRIGLGAILGYLAAGVLIGPDALGLIADGEEILHFAEFGVVLLLFVIGLELQPSRLWVMRNAVFGLGGAQVVISAGVIGGMAYAMGNGFGPAVVIGFGLALSSTAFVLQLLAEKNQLPTHHGRAAFAILLFQDVVVIPILALIPILGVQSTVSDGTPVWLAIAQVAGMIVLVIVGGHYLLRPVLRRVAATEIPELFTATGLLIVIGTALLMDAVGVSMALGAFMAGMLLADSEYRHELEADIEPFKGLLLGLFFISVGMSINLDLIAESPVTAIGLTVGLLACKGAVLYTLGRLWKLKPMSAKDLACVLPQGGEFAFVIFTTAVAAGVLPIATSELLIVVVGLSMAATPIIGVINERLTKMAKNSDEPVYDNPPADEGHVIIAGFGRFGQIVGRVLAGRKIAFTALDISADQVDFVKRYGSKIYYGDASRLDLLRAAKAHEARAFVLAIDDVEASLATAEVVRKHFPRLEIYARARNRQHAYRLMDLGIIIIWRETFVSSLELTRDLLIGLGDDRAQADDIIGRFHEHDRMRLFEHYTHHNDEEKMQDLAKAEAKELEEMFARDAEEVVLINDPPTDRTAAE
jgi:monovalent cation:proton antiporter-2 (CPA2) family protein